MLDIKVIDKRVYNVGLMSFPESVNLTNHSFEIYNIVVPKQAPNDANINFLTIGEKSVDLQT